MTLNFDMTRLQGLRTKNLDQLPRSTKPGESKIQMVRAFDSSLFSPRLLSSSSLLRQREIPFITKRKLFYRTRWAGSNESSSGLLF